MPGSAFTHAGLDWQEYVELAPHYLRPSAVDDLLGDPSKAEKDLGWKAGAHWDSLAGLMTDADVVAFEPCLS